MSDDIAYKIGSFAAGVLRFSKENNGFTGQYILKITLPS